MDEREQGYSALVVRLRRQRTDIIEGLASLDAAGLPVELDQTVQGRISRMDAIAQQQMARAGQGHLRIELTRIDAALRRYDERRYGICCRCEEDIALARLQADPATPLCLDCAQTAEAQR